MRRRLTSTTHHSRLVYDSPATQSSPLQLARKTGRHIRPWSKLLWTMHALSSQMVGSPPCFAAQAARASNFLPGAVSSSRHEWLKKASTSPGFAASVFFARSSALVDGATSLGAARELLRPESARSAGSRRETRTQRKRAFAVSSTARASAPLPTRAAMAAAFCCSSPLLPSEPSQRMRRPRTEGAE